MHAFLGLFSKLFYYSLFYGKYTKTIVWNASRLYLCFYKYKDKCTKPPHHSKPFKCSRPLAKGVLHMCTMRGIYNWIADYTIIMIVHKIMWILKISRGLLVIIMLIVRTMCNNYYNYIYNRILHHDWFSASLFVT